MKALLKVSTATLTCIAMTGCAGLVRQHDGHLNISGLRNPVIMASAPAARVKVPANVQKRAVFCSQEDGFEFEIPPGWEVSTARISEFHSMVTVSRRPQGLSDGFYVWKCPGPGPKGCMVRDYMPATLVKTDNVRMAGLPAKEYTFDRQTVSRTRIWKEVVTVLNTEASSYGLVVQIPHDRVEKQYLSLYQQMRDSFRLIGNQ